jgi:dolichol-phosphate mannosyltransferase
MKKFSIIVPIYYNETNLPVTIPRLLKIGETINDLAFELIFVDDGSGDKSLDVLLDYQSKFPEIIKVVKLSRNFGSMSAILAGLEITDADCVGMISADLQDPPELFIEMLNHWENGVKAVFAVRQDRDESLFRKWFSNLYYFFINIFAVSNYPKGGFDFFLIDRQVVKEVVKIQEKNTNLMTLIFWLGFKPVMIPYTRQARELGKSRWTLSKKTKLFIDTFVSFSFFPIRLFSVIGFIVAFVSFFYGVYVLIDWSSGGTIVRGWVPMMLVMTFTSGIQITMLGILGEYLWRTLDEVRRRPSFVIEHIYENKEKV